MCSGEVRGHGWILGAEEVEEDEEGDLGERGAVLVEFGGWRRGIAGI